MRARALAAACAAVLMAVGAAGALTIQTVPVGNAGNPGEWSGESYGGFGSNRICGAVAYNYNIGTYEVTTGQYTEFLNAAAKSDPHGLYSTLMWSGDRACKIERSGSGAEGDPYSYSVAADRANRPVNYVSFWDACRFANWLNNGQGSADTENGAYTLNTETISNNIVSRNEAWRWAVSSEDEWYKAAYHKNDGVTGNYWDYPTGSNSISPTQANFGYVGTAAPLRDVGSYDLASPYGTFDQGGNVWEWNEDRANSPALSRGVRGGAVNCMDPGTLSAADRLGAGAATYEDYNIGFRMVNVSEPASLSLLAVAGLGMLAKRRGS